MLHYVTLNYYIIFELLHLQINDVNILVKLAIMGIFNP